MIPVVPLHVFWEVVFVIVLLLISLLFSGLRTSFASALASETPWERSHSGYLELPDRDQRVTLLFLQRVSILLGFIVLARVFWELYLFTGHEISYGLPVFIVVAWLWSDAIIRFHCGRYAVSISRRIVPVLKPFFRVIKPVSRVVVFLGERWGLVTLDRQAVSDEKFEGPVENEEERELLRGLVTFGQTTARQGMQPRVNITAFDIEWDFHELMDKINKSGYSRVPVYRESMDAIEGILYVKDLLPHLHKNEHFEWQKLLRKAYLIPESKRLDDLLQEFQNRRVHLAIVIDEYGGTSGLITIEDIIEEIFGDINDEYDKEEEINYTRIDDHTYLFEGKTPVNDFTRILNLDPDYFWQVREDAESLAGLLLELFSGLPKAGAETKFRDVGFTVQSADKKRIKKVKVVI